MNWYTPAEFSDEIQQLEQLAARFKTIEIAAEFEKIFNVYWELGSDQASEGTNIARLLYPYEDKPTCPGCRGCEDRSLKS